MLSMVEDGDNKFDDRLAKFIQDSMAYAANETRLLGEFEKFFSPRAGDSLRLGGERESLILAYSLNH